MNGLKRAVLILNVAADLKDCVCDLVLYFLSELLSSAAGDGYIVNERCCLIHPEGQVIVLVWGRDLTV